MDLLLQSLVMGVVQGLTEFLPVSSSGHLIIVPSLLGWDDSFINSLTFSVMLHMGTLIALLAYFWRDWVRLVPAGFTVLRDRSLGNDPDRLLAWLIAVATIPAALAGLLFNDLIESSVRHIGLVAAMLVAGGAVLWLAERWGSRRRGIESLRTQNALAIGAAQALALIPGISRSGISISAGLFAGLDRASAARFSFLMATPVTALAGAYEFRKLISGEAGAVQIEPLVIGVVASLVSGVAAIHFLLRFLRTNSTFVFIAYRVALAALVAISLVSR